MFLSIQTAVNLQQKGLARIPRHIRCAPSAIELDDFVKTLGGCSAKSFLTLKLFYISKCIRLLESRDLSRSNFLTY